MRRTGSPPFEGTLVAESLRIGTFDTLDLIVTSIVRTEVSAPAATQPRAWTLISFAVASDRAEPFAAALQDRIDADGAWYCDFTDGRETFVVFGGRTHRYRNDDRAARAAAVEHARSIGIPEQQLDWGS